MATSGLMAAGCFDEQRIALPTHVVELLSADLNEGRRFAKAVLQNLHPLRARVCSGALMVNATNDTVGVIKQALEKLSDEETLVEALATLQSLHQSPVRFRSLDPTDIVVWELILDPTSLHVKKLMGSDAAIYFHEAHLVRATFFTRCDWAHHMSVVLVGPRDGVERVEPYYGTPCLCADTRANHKGTGWTEFVHKGSVLGPKGVVYPCVVLPARAYKVEGMQKFGGRAHVRLVGEEEASQRGVLTVINSTRYCEAPPSSTTPSVGPLPSPHTSAGVAKRKALLTDESASMELDETGPPQYRVRVTTE